MKQTKRKPGTRIVLAAIFALLPLQSLLAQSLIGESVPDELLVRMRPDLSPRQRNATLTEGGGELIRRFEAVGIDHLRLPDGQSARATILALQTNPDVVSVQPNYIRHIVVNPNDPQWLSGSLYGMQRIQVPPVWPDFVTEHGTVVVASIDTGVEYTHPDLAANMWRNPDELPGNQIDDDGNGYVDDLHGIDSINNDSDPMDDHGHGTHTAGTMAGVGNNGMGIIGVHPTAQIIACKSISSAGSGTDAGAIACFDYLIALKNRGINVRVTNNSWGETRLPGMQFPAALKDAMDAAGAAGILNVCAAGNSNSNNEGNPYEPASFTSPSIVSVAASDGHDDRAGFSNYGATTVDLAAPGVSIISTMTGGYQFLSGTSMAAPRMSRARLPCSRSGTRHCPPTH